MFLTICLINLNSGELTIDFLKYLACAITIHLCPNLPFGSCYHSSYLIHLVLYNYRTYFINLKLLLRTTDLDGEEKEVFCSTNGIYPHHIPLSYSQYVNFFSSMRAKITKMNVGIISEDQTKYLRLTEHESIKS